MEPTQDNSQDQKHLIPLAFVLVVALGGLGYYYWQTSTQSKYTPEELQAIDRTERMLLAKINQSAEAAVLKDTIPAAAPVQNPVDGMYKNPFE